MLDSKDGCFPIVLIDDFFIPILEEAGFGACFSLAVNFSDEDFFDNVLRSSGGFFFDSFVSDAGKCSGFSARKKLRTETRFASGSPIMHINQLDTIYWEF